MSESTARGQAGLHQAGSAHNAPGDAKISQCKAPVVSRASVTHQACHRNGLECIQLKGVLLCIQLDIILWLLQGTCTCLRVGRKVEL